MKILLTGSSGYIGRSLAPHLIRAGHSVVGFDRRPARSEVTHRDVVADLRDHRALHDAMDGVEAILHLAAAKGDWGISESEFFRDNVEATQELLAVGRECGVRRWVFYSTVAALGPSEVPLTEDAPFSPVIPYGASKAEGERLFHRFAEEEPDARILVIRPSVVFGPGNPRSTNIFRLIDAIHRGHFVMVGDGSPVKTTSYIDNLIAAHLFLMERMEPGLRTFICVDRPSLSTGELVTRIYGLLGKRRPSWHLPLSVVKPVAYLGDALAAVTGRDLPITAARVQKFCSGTNFDPAALFGLGFRQPVDIDEALRRTVEWHRARASSRQGPPRASAPST